MANANSGDVFLLRYKRTVQQRHLTYGDHQHKKDAPPWTCQHVSRHFLQMTSALKRHLLLPASFKHVKCHLFPLLSRPIPPWHFLIFNSSVKLYISPFRKDFPLSTYCQLECIENRCVFFFDHVITRGQRILASELDWLFISLFYS